jgi:hypothetical protein
MTPTEAFDPNRDGGLDSLGPEPEEMDELSEPEPEEMGAEAPAAAGEESLAGEQAVGEKTPMDAMTAKEKQNLEKIKEQISKGKLKKKELDKALETVGFKKKDIETLMNIKAKGKWGDCLIDRVG